MNNADIKWSEAVDIVNKGISNLPAISESSEIMHDALARIANWNEHPSDLVLNKGANGLRDYYKAIAIKAIEDSEALLQQLEGGEDE